MVLALLILSYLRRLPLLVSQIMSHLGPKHPFVQPLGQLLHDPPRTAQIFRPLVALHQLFNDGRIYLRLLAFLALRFLLLLLGHFHLLLPQVVTHTQILGHAQLTPNFIGNRRSLPRASLIFSSHSTPSTPHRNFSFLAPSLRNSGRHRQT